MACYRPETVSRGNVGHDDNQARAATSMASTPVSSVGWVTGAKFGEWLGCPGRSVRPARPCCKYPGPCLKRAGLPHIRFHDHRHTYATLLLSKNVHPKFVQELLGHATITITLDTYSHVLPGMGDHSARHAECARSYRGCAYWLAALVCRGPGSASRPSILTRKILLFAGKT